MTQNGISDPNYNSGQQNLDLIQLTRQLIRYGLKNIKTILLVGLISLVVTLGLYFQAEPVYESRMTAETLNLDAARVVDLIKDLDQLREQLNYELLSEKMNLTKDQVRRIDEITVEKIIGDKGKEEEAKVFTLEARVTYLDLLDTLDYGISHYLSNNAYASVRMELYRRDLQAEISKIETEMAELDSSKGLSLEDLDIDRASEKLAFNLKSSSNISLELVELYQEKLKLEQELELAEEVSVIQNFTKFDMPVSPRLSIYLAVGLVASLVVLGIMAFLQAVFKDDRPSEQGARNQVKEKIGAGS